MPNPLLVGLGAGLSFFGQARYNDYQEQEKLAAQAAKAKADADADMRKQENAASLRDPDFKTMDDIQDGVRGKRTIKSHYDPAQRKVVSEDQGFVADEAKAPTTRNVIDGGNEATQQFNTKTGEWETIGSPGPRFAPRDPSAGGADRVSFGDYQSMTPEQQATYRAYKAPGSQGESEDDKADKAARSQTAMALRDFNKLSRYEKMDALKAAGIDPGVPDGDTKAPISADALQKYRNTLRDDNLTLMGAPLFNNRGGKVSGGAASTAPQAQQPSPLLSSAQSNGGNSPAQPDAPTMRELTAQATKAVANGADKQQVEARLLQLMRQYGYQPQ